MEYSIMAHKVCMSSPKISITVAAYNVGKWLEDCLNSVVAQTMRDFECIVVDDCSRDISPDIAEAFAREDSRFQLVRHDANKGLATVRRTGLKHCRGEYVLQIDGDDYLDNTALETLLCIAQRDGCDIVRGGYMIDYEGEFVPGAQSSWGKISNAHFSRLRPLYVAPSGLVLNLFRRAFLDKLEIETLPLANLGEDFIFNAHAYTRAKKVSLTDDVVYYYRRRKGSYTTAHSNKRKHIEESFAHKFVFEEWKDYPQAQVVFMIVLTSFRVGKILDAVSHLSREEAIHVIDNYKSIYDQWEPHLAYALVKKTQRFGWSWKKNPFFMQMAERLHYMPAERIYDYMK